MYLSMYTNEANELPKPGAKALNDRYTSKESSCIYTCALKKSTVPSEIPKVMLQSEGKKKKVIKYEHEEKKKGENG